MAVFLLSILVDVKKFRTDMGNPIMASVSFTFPMAVMLLATYLNPYIGGPAKVIWYVGVALHVVMIIWFSVKFLRGLCPGAGICQLVHRLCGHRHGRHYGRPPFQAAPIGSACVVFGLVTLVVLLVLVTVRYVKKPVPKPAQPLICIYAAPTSLCIAGYVQSVTPKSLPLLLVLWVLATVLFLFACVKFVQYLRLPFFPSYAAFTFPFVISAIASKQLMACAANLGSPLPFLSTVVLIETVIATFTTLYALVRYLMFLFAGSKQPAKERVSSR